jgi:hypothetical protein
MPTACVRFVYRLTQLTYSAFHGVLADCFSLRKLDAPFSDSDTDYDEDAYVDAEDPKRSSWARYINHADAGECNATSNVDTANRLVWFHATRDILNGEEITFNYQGGDSDP